MTSNSSEGIGYICSVAWLSPVRLRRQHELSSHLLLHATGARCRATPCVSDMQV